MEISQGVVAIRLLATCMVVIIHISALILNNNASDNLAWLSANFIDSMSRPAVPLFLMISGYLTLKPGKYSSVSFFYKKRYSRIIPSLLFWTLIYFVLSNIVYYITNKSFNWELFIHNLYVGEIFYHLWYIYMLLGLILITPAIQFVIRKTSVDLFFVLTVLFCLISLLICLFDVDYDNWFFLFRCFPYISYYLLGYCLSNITVNKTLLCICILIGFLSTFIGKKYCNDIDCYAYRYLSINVMVCSISIFLLFKNIKIKSKLIFDLSFVSLGVYYSHPLVIKLVEYLILDDLLQNTFLFLLTVLFVILFSYIISFVLNKNKVFKRFVV